MAKQRNGPTISRIEQDRKAAVGKGGIEREDRLHVVLLEDILPDLKLVLLLAAQPSSAGLNTAKGPSPACRYEFDDPRQQYTM